MIILTLARHLRRLHPSVNLQKCPSFPCFKSALSQLTSTNIVHCMKRNCSSNAVKSTPRPKVRRSEMRRLWRLAKHERGRLFWAVILLSVSSGVTMSMPYCIGKVIDVIYDPSAKEDFQTRLKLITLALLGLFLFGALANFGRSYLMLSSGARIVNRLRQQLYSAILRQETAFFDRNRTGELINRLSNDATLVGSAVTQNVSDGLRSSVQAVAGVGMMFYVSPKLALISLAIVPPIFGFSVLYGRYVRKLTRNVQDSLADATQVAEERISNIRTVRAFAQESVEENRYSQSIEQVLKLSYTDAVARGAFWGLMGFSGNVVVLSVFYFGGMMSHQAALTVGELSSFLLYAVFTGLSINGLSSFFTETMRGLGASSRLWQIIDRQPNIPLQHGRKLPGDFLSEFRFSDVHFRYPSRPEVAILSGLDLDIPSNSVMAVVGASGSGKSTIASLLLRLYDPDSGSVKMDGVDLRELDPSWLRQQIGTVSQEPALFSCSIAENIAYGSSNPLSVTTKQIEEAARAANALNFIKGFPDGLNTTVGERGVMLSGGQKQRIAIARAILSDPPMLLLDEATSALDAESEHLVQEALSRLSAGRTVLTIAHRLSTIRNAQCIALLDQGKVVELGDYPSLLSTDGLFRRLVDRQTFAK